MPSRSPHIQTNDDFARRQASVPIPTIVLLIASREDRRLLRDFLMTRYDVCCIDFFDPDDLDVLISDPFDLCIVDGICLDRYRERIEAVRSENSEVFLPFLFAAGRRGLGHATEGVWRLVDEVIRTPIQKSELMARVEILLRARQYSLRLRRRYYDLAEIAPVGILLLDRDGTIRHANRHSAQLLKIGSRDLEGRSYDDMGWIATDRDGKRLQAEEKPFQTVIRTGRAVFDRKIALVRPDDDEQLLSVNAAPLSVQESDRIDGVVVTLKDSTEQEHYERELRIAKTQAEEMSRLKSVLLANMSHEIRTPLTGILGFADILGSEVEGELREFTDFIRVSGERLMGTLNSVLDLAQLESKGWILEHSPFDVRDLARSCIKSCGPDAAAKGLHLQMDLPDEPLFIKQDEKAVAKLLGNLLSNAVKFTAEGTVKLAVRKCGETVQLSVSDTGIGISPDAMPLIFDAFWQESKGVTREFEGIGLGLSLVKHLVTLMHGAVTVRSKKGEGSTFTITLPAAPNAERARLC